MNVRRKTGADITSRRGRAGGTFEEYKVLVENLKDILWIMDIATLTFDYVSPAVREVRGFTMKETLQQKLAEALTPASYKVALTALKQELAADKKRKKKIPISRILELEHSCKDGSTVWLEVTASILRDKQENLSKVVGVAHDITGRREAERALQLKNIELNSFLNNIPDMAWLKDTNSNFIAANKAFGEVVGMNPEYLVNHSCEVCFGKKAAGKFKADDQKVIKGKKQIIIEESIIDAKKNKVWLETIKSPILNESEKVVGTVGVARDITARRKAEEALRESEERFRNIFDNATDGILLVDVRTKKFRIGNKAICQMLGYSLAKIKNLGISDIHPKKDLAHVLEQFEKQCRGEISIARDIPIKRKDGSIAYADINAFPITLGGKEYLGGIFRNITARKNTEEALRMSENKFRLFFENNPEYCYMISPEGIILNINNAALKALGYRKKELVGKSLKAIYAPESMKKAKQLFKKWKKDGRFQNEGMTIITRKGKRREVLLSVEAIRDEGGEIIHSLSVQTDVTEQRKAEKALRRSSTSLAEAQRIAHLGNWVWNIQKNEIRWSDEIYRIFGLSPREFGANYETFLGAIHPDDRDAVDKAIQAAFKRHRPYKIEHRILRPSGVERIVYEQGEVTRNAQGRPTRMFGIVQDITERKKIEEELRKHQENLAKLVEQRTAKLAATNAALREAEKELQRLVEIDGLTGVSNYRHLQKRLNEEFCQSQKTGETLACVMVDLDNFKEINDHYGHQVGDKVLQIIAEILQHELRRKDLVARYGGEEFLILLAQKPSHQSGLEQVLERIREKISERSIHFGKYHLQITASLGAVLLPDPRIRSVNRFVHEADKAMYRAKAAGKNCWRVFE